MLYLPGKRQLWPWACDGLAAGAVLVPWVWASALEGAGLTDVRAHRSATNAQEPEKTLCAVHNTRAPLAFYSRN